MAGEGAAAVLDLEHVTLVDVEGRALLKRLLRARDRTPPLSTYIREWIAPGAKARSRDSIGAWFTAVRTEGHVGSPC